MTGPVHEPSTLHSAFRCETGAVRERNEDACLAFDGAAGGHFGMPVFGLYVVADGMGGHTSGHIASSAATRAFSEFVVSHIYLPLLRDKPLPPDAEMLELLERAVIAAHEAVYRPEPDEDGGSTLTAAVISGRHCYIAHVGDSRAYLYTAGEMTALTTDHSLARRLQDQGRLSAEDVPYYQYRNVLLQALGQEVALEIDTFALELPLAGALLLCSDGLCGYVPEAAIVAVLASDDPPQMQADRLYEAAMGAGGIDNITAVVVQYAGYTG